MPCGPGVDARLAFGAARRRWAGIPGRRFSHAIHTTNTSKGAARVGHGRLSTLRWRHVRAYADYQHFGGPPQIINYRQIVSACQAGGKKTTDLQLGVKEIIDRFHQSSFQSSRVVIH